MIEDKPNGSATGTTLEAMLLMRRAVDALECIAATLQECFPAAVDTIEQLPERMS